MFFVLIAAILAGFSLPWLAIYWTIQEFRGRR